MFGRKKTVLTHGQQMRDELAQSYDHLKLAAAHAAGGTAERMTPAYDRARRAAVRRLTTTRSTFTPMYLVRMGGATGRGAHKEQEKKSRWPAFLGILAAGAAVGATGAVISRRRRNAAQWEEYEPLPAMGETGLGAETETGGAGTPSAASKVTAGAAAAAGKVAETVRGKTGAGKGPDISGTATSPETGTMDETAQRLNQDRDQGGTFSGFADESRGDRPRS